MKILRLLSVLGIALCLNVSRGFAVVPREEAWAKVTAAAEDDQPQTVVELLKPIEIAAFADQAWAEGAKALAMRVLTAAALTQDETAPLKQLTAAIPAAPAAARPILRVIEADLMFAYFQENWGSLADRSPALGAANADMATWDLPRLLAETDQRFQAALAEPAALKEIPVTEFGAILAKGELGDALRPTLFDFVAHEALRFYTSAILVVASPADVFEIDATSPALADAAAFLAWQPAVTDAASLNLRALRLYQDLINFHRTDADRTAFRHCDLARLRWAAGLVGETGQARSEAALRAFIAANAQHPVSADARLDVAHRLDLAGKHREAHDFAKDGATAFPEHPFGKLCQAIVRELEATEIQAKAMTAWTPAGADIFLQHKNLSQVWLRLYPLKWEAAAATLDADPLPSWEALPAILAKPPARAWDAKLPDDRDFRTRVTKLPAPRDLPPGYYLLAISTQRDFTLKDNHLLTFGVHVGTRAVVVCANNHQPDRSGLVTDAVTGAPLAGVAVSQWSERKLLPGLERQRTKTDADGAFSLRCRASQSLVAAGSGADLAVARPCFYGYDPKPTTAEPKVIFFTDRALYRPGQPIHFKGIICQADQQKAAYRTLADHPIKVTFSDPNKKPLQELTLVPNALGSFEGTVTAPSGSVLGRCQLAAGKMGSAGVSVEEYKRPKFFVTLKPPAAPTALGGKVTVTGKAEAYSGAAVDGAKVVMKVRRRAVLADWYYSPRSGNSEEVKVTAVSAVTAADGSFEASFTAEPDPKLDPAMEPAFHFEIAAEVTDPAGETRTADTVVTVAYTTLKADLSADTWQEVGKPVKIKVSTASHDGTAVAAAGTLRIHRIQEPAVCPLANDAPPFEQDGEAPPNPLDTTRWPLGELVKELPAATVLSADGKQAVVEPASELPAGLYRAVFETKDAKGRQVRAFHELQVLQPASPTFLTKLPFHTACPVSELEPGETFTILWGSGLTAARACVEWLKDGKLLKREWSAPGRTQQTFTMTPDESLRGGFTVRVTQTTGNRLHEEETVVDVPWTNKDLKLRWEHLSSKLEPGAKDVWTAVVTGPDGQPAAAELVATLYDASLDAFETHCFDGFVGLFRSEDSSVTMTFYNGLGRGNTVAEPDGGAGFVLDSPFRRFTPGISKTLDELAADQDDYGAAILRQAIFQTPEGRRFATTPMCAGGAAPAPVKSEGGGVTIAGLPRGSGGTDGLGSIRTGGNRSGDGAINRSSIDAILNRSPFDATGNYIGPKEPDHAAPVAIRKNLQETAFFFPQLTSNEKGEIRMAFTMPEALTTWRFLGFAHDAALRSGSLEGETVTAKNLMVQPNPPRFLREGDTLEFTVKITNRGDQAQTGTAHFSLTDSATGADRTAALGITTPDQPWSLPAKESRTLTWRLAVPDGTGFLTYKASATSGALSDGEEGWLPVIPRRVLLTESMTLPSRSLGTRDFTFQKLVDSGQSTTLEHRFVQLQVVSRPAWYAVMALPYLMEYPHECAEQTFNRYYANALARHLAKSDPKLRRIFDLWQNTPALDSPLAKNPELKGITLDETPWLAEAADQSQARRNLGRLFDDNQLEAELEKALEKLTSMQCEDGLWPWFPGGGGNHHISLCIATGFARLRAMGVETDITPALKALAKLDAELTAQLGAIKRAAKGQPEFLTANHLDSAIAQQLYTRTLFLKDRKVSRDDREAFDFFVAQAKRHWAKLDSRLSRAHVALALNRLGEQATAKLITRSLREHAIRTPESGMSWRDDTSGWYWWQAPIETQAMMIEAFREIDHDDQAVENCQVWLIQQKQVRDWRSTKATADAIHALLLGGKDLLSGGDPLQVSLGGVAVKPEAVEPGTGYYEARFTGPAVKPELGRIQVTQTAPGIAWASVHWQYLEDLAKVTAHDTAGFKLEKALFVRKAGPQGPRLEPVAGPLNVGDELVTRLILRNDRAMEFVHLKDSRGSGTEPMNVLSGYRWQDGFGYYEVTRDTASHFFIDTLPAGTHVFESSVRLQHGGSYQSGVAEIRCLYAPEFSAHSASGRLEVGR
ncbi:MAG: alpha-2-macroglobulin family protein [Verrucomicrobiota bacterium]